MAPANNRINVTLLHALTIDVEDYFQVAAFTPNIATSDWDGIKTRVVANTRHFMDVAAQHNVHATFFFLGWIAKRHPELVKEVAAAGHEIASHGFSHQLVYQQTPQTFREEAEYSKKLLEDLSGAPVLGYRAASYSITQKSLWALEIIQELGFEYDSSIFPVKHDRYGLQGGPHVPYDIALPNGAHLREFPITTVNVGGYRMPVGGGGYFRIYPFAMTKKLLARRLRQSSAPFVFYLHPWELDPDQPRVSGASLLSRFRHYYNLDEVEPRLHELLKLFDFGTMRGVLDTVHDFPQFSYATPNGAA